MKKIERFIKHFADAYPMTLDEASRMIGLPLAKKNYTNEYWDFFETTNLLWDKDVLFTGITVSRRTGGDKVGTISLGLASSMPCIAPEEVNAFHPDLKFDSPSSTPMELWREGKPFYTYSLYKARYNEKIELSFTFKSLYTYGKYQDPMCLSGLSISKYKPPEENK